MNAKHTPGPWRIVEDGGFRGIFHLGTGRKVAAVIGSIREGEHIEANAHLIAAAPDLLEALRKVSAALEAVYESEMEWTGEWDMLPPDALEMAKAAIRKAEGK